MTRVAVSSKGGPVSRSDRPLMSRRQFKKAMANITSMTGGCTQAGDNGRVAVGKDVSTETSRAASRPAMTGEQSASVVGSHTSGQAEQSQHHQLLQKGVNHARGGSGGGHSNRRGDAVQDWQLPAELRTSIEQLEDWYTARVAHAARAGVGAGSASGRESGSGGSQATAVAALSIAIRRLADSDPDQPSAAASPGFGADGHVRPAAAATTPAAASSLSPLSSSRQSGGGGVRGRIPAQVQPASVKSHQISRVNITRNSRVRTKRGRSRPRPRLIVPLPPTVAATIPAGISTGNPNLHFGGPIRWLTSTLVFVVSRNTSSMLVPSEVPTRLGMRLLPNLRLQRTR